MIKSFVEAYFTYRLLKIIAKPWESTPAFKAGIIDKDGKKIVDELTDLQKKSYGSFDRIAYNLKRLMTKVPAGQNPFVRYATAIALVRESTLQESEVEDLVNMIDEDTPVNTSGGGNVAYTETPMTKKPLRRKKKLGETLGFNR